jgi:hypothetical protein
MHGHSVAAWMMGRVMGYHDDIRCSSIDSNGGGLHKPYPE